MNLCCCLLKFCRRPCTSAQAGAFTAESKLDACPQIRYKIISTTAEGVADHSEITTTRHVHGPNTRRTPQPMPTYIPELR